MILTKLNHGLLPIVCFSRIKTVVHYGIFLPSSMIATNRAFKIHTSRQPSAQKMSSQDHSQAAASDQPPSTEQQSSSDQEVIFSVERYVTANKGENEKFRDAFERLDRLQDILHETETRMEAMFGEGRDFEGMHGECRLLFVAAEPGTPGSRLYHIHSDEGRSILYENALNPLPSDPQSILNSELELALEGYVEFVRFFDILDPFWRCTAVDRLTALHEADNAVHGEDLRRAATRAQIERARQRRSVRDDSIERDRFEMRYGITMEEVDEVIEAEIVEGECQPQ